MIRTPPAPARDGHVPALDVFRGLAALLMVVNHVGFWTLSPTAAAQGVTGSLVFLGSFAPVLFFFAVGFGAGLSSGPGPLQARLDKALLLLAADQLMFWAGGVAAGLDFFGFIALSMLVVWAVQRSAHPVGLALALIAAAFLARYAITGPLPAGLDNSLLARWLLGRSVLHVSYPAAPWLVFPLLGFLLALGWRRLHGHPGARVWAALAAAAGACLLVALAFALRGAPFFRWGVVSAGFFILAVGLALACALVAAGLQHRFPRAASLLALGGVASFAVVPLHHALIHSGALPRGLVSPAAFVMLATTCVVVAFAASRGFAAALRRFWPRPPGAIGLVLAALGTCVLAAAAYVLGARGAPNVGNLAAAAAQLGLVAFFAWRVGLLGQLRTFRARKEAVAARSG